MVIFDVFFLIFDVLFVLFVYVGVGNVGYGVYYVVGLFIFFVLIE